MRTLVDLKAAQVDALDRLARRKDRSRAALVREAVDDYLARHGQDDDDEAFGLWSAAATDGVEFQDRARREW